MIRTLPILLLEVILIHTSFPSVIRDLYFILSFWPSIGDPYFPDSFPRSTPDSYFFLSIFTEYP